MHLKLIKVTIILAKKLKLFLCGLYDFVQRNESYSSY